MIKNNTLPLVEPILLACKRLRRSIIVLALFEVLTIMASAFVISKTESDAVLFLLVVALISLLLLNDFFQHIPKTEEKLWRFRKSDANTVPFFLLLSSSVQFLLLVFISFLIFIGAKVNDSFIRFFLFSPFLFLGCFLFFLLRFAAWRRVLLSRKSKEEVLCIFDKMYKKVNILIGVLAAVMLIRISYFFTGFSEHLPHKLNLFYGAFSILGFIIFITYPLYQKFVHQQSANTSHYFFNLAAIVVCIDVILCPLSLFLSKTLEFFNSFESFLIILIGIFECCVIYYFFQYHIIQSLKVVTTWKDNIAEFLQHNFANDPLFSLAFGNNEKGTEAMKRYFYYTVDYCDRYGRVNVNTDMGAVLAWIPIDYFPPQPDHSLNDFCPEAMHRFENHEQTPESIINENGNEYGYIWALAVSPEKRRSGLASQMLSEAALQMKNWDLTECWLTTEKPENQMFYQKNNFQLFRKAQTGLDITTFVFKKNLVDEK